MRPQMLLLTLAVIAALAALPLAQSKGHGATAGAWPCCDECDACARSKPPQCWCMDASPVGCNPACKTCVKSTIDGIDGFRCKDRIVNFCERRCTSAA